jgi:uncharacterized protein (TIGR00255 family)
MSLMSMTGYGRGESEGQGVKVEVELSSVNRKQFDLRLSLPRSLMALESQISKIVHAKVSRGCVTGNVRVTTLGNARSRGIRVNEQTAAKIVKELRAVGSKLKLADNIGVGDLARLPEVICYEDVSEDSSKVWPVLKRALNDAVEALVAMRSAEGERLARDLNSRFALLRKRVEQIAKIAPAVPNRYRKALIKRIEEAELPVSINEDQIVKEVALFADRCSISEEVVRLKSHFEQSDQLLQSKQPTGRAFDFLCQELLREINTIGSKANDARLSKHVIAFKTELECIREQVQNIE